MKRFHRFLSGSIVLGCLCLCFSACGSDFTSPATPAGTTATAGKNQVTIAWTAVSGATSYNIYWSTVAGVTGPVGTNGTPIFNVTSPFTQTGLTAGTTYYYVVTSMNANAESPASDQVSAVPF